MDANILYTAKTKNDFINKGINGKNLHVANKTIDVKNDAKSFRSKVKNKIIFVGTLNVRKELDRSIEAFKLIPIKSLKI